MNIKNSITFKILMFVLIVTSILLGVHSAVWLMNQPSTFKFVCGIMIIILVTAGPIEYVIRKTKK